MADQRPDRLVGGERETVQALLQFQRDSVVRKVTGVEDADARRSPLPSGTSLLWLVEHLSHAERLWVLHRFAGHDLGPPDPGLHPDPAATDTPPSGGALAGAIAAYRSTWAAVDRVIAATPTLDEPCRNIGDGPPANLRWVLMHLLEETARHAGHADLLRELIDGSTGR